MSPATPTDHSNTPRHFFALPASFQLDEFLGGTADPSIVDIEGSNIGDILGSPLLETPQDFEETSEQDSSEQEKSRQLEQNRTRSMFPHTGAVVDDVAGFAPGEHSTTAPEGGYTLRERNSTPSPGFNLENTEFDIDDAEFNLENSGFDLGMIDDINYDAFEEVGGGGDEDGDETMSQSSTSTSASTGSLEGCLLYRFFRVLILLLYAVVKA